MNIHCVEYDYYYFIILLFYIRRAQCGLGVVSTKVCYPTLNELLGSASIAHVACGADHTVFQLQVGKGGGGTGVRGRGSGVREGNWDRALLTQLVMRE